MPNWCSNNVRISHEDPQMVERVLKGFKGEGLLEEFIPVPADLKITAGRVGGDEDEAQKALVLQEQANLEKYGYSNWYDYCVNEWGTKWDVNAEDATLEGNTVSAYFDSAWSPPISAYEKLADLGFSIYATYYEPGMGFAGIWDDGSDDFYEFGGLSADEIEDQLPGELDEQYGISESVREWEENEAEDYEDNDEENIDIDLDGGVSATNEQKDE